MFGIKRRIAIIGHIRFLKKHLKSVNRDIEDLSKDVNRNANMIDDSIKFKTELEDSIKKFNGLLRGC